MRRRRHLLPIVSASALIAGCSGALASPQPDCFERAARTFAIDASLLRAIAKVESNFNPTAIAHAKDGTRSVGVMQINSSHFPRLRQHRITEEVLFSHPCTNVAVGASILADFIAQYGPTWRAVGAYGAGTSKGLEAARAIYASQVRRAWARQLGHAPRGLASAIRNPAPSAVRDEQMAVTQ